MAKLLRYESSQLEADKLTTLDEYVSRASPDQNELYYLCAPSRAIAEASPYFEAFKYVFLERLLHYVCEPSFLTRCCVFVQENEQGSVVRVQSD